MIEQILVTKKIGLSINTLGPSELQLGVASFSKSGGAELYAIYGSSHGYAKIGGCCQGHRVLPVCIDVYEF